MTQDGESGGPEIVPGRRLWHVSTALFAGRTPGTTRRDACFHECEGQLGACTSGGGLKTKNTNGIWRATGSPKSSVFQKCPEKWTCRR